MTLGLSETLPLALTGRVAAAAAWIAFCPALWTVFAQLELRTRLLSRLAGGDRRAACRGYAALVFLLGLCRDSQFHQVLLDPAQPASPLLAGGAVLTAAYVLFAVGAVLVLTSMWQLGVTGTYNGDHFGILFEERITCFPFSVVDNPMYLGSFLCFLGTALHYAKPAGVLLSAWVAVMYVLTLRFEGPYTARIYAKRDARLRAQNNNGTYNGISNGTLNGISNGTSNGISNGTSNGISNGTSKLKL